MTAEPDRRWSPAVVAVVCLAALLAVLIGLSAPPLPAAASTSVASTPGPAHMRPAAPTQPSRASGGLPRAETATDTALNVELTSVTPSALDPGEPLTLEGRITNVDDQAWRRMRAYLVVSPSPLTTRAELAATTESPAESYFGDRVTQLGTFDRLGQLAPEDVMTFRVSVPWRLLRISGAPGVYTAGVHVLATDADGNRPLEAVARARTYVPLVDERATAPVRLAMVWRITAPVRRRSDGTYARSEGLIAAMETGGRLRRLVDLGRTAAGVPLTVVPDPAVLDAAEDLGTGTFGPPGGLVERVRVGPAPPPAEAEAENSTSAGASATTAAADHVPVAIPAVAAWYDDARELASSATPWSTLYGEPSVDTLAAFDIDALSRTVGAVTAGAQKRQLGGLGSVLTMPRDGVVASGSLAQLRGSAGDGRAAFAPRMLPGWEPLDGSAQRLDTGEGPLDAVVADPALAGGGPAPGEVLSALQVRQRLLAETALLGITAAASGVRSTTATFLTPHEWDPGPDWGAAGFFSGIDVPWLDPVPLGELLAAPATYEGTPGVSGRSPVSQPLDTLSETTITAAMQLRRRARVLADLVDGQAPLRLWYEAPVALAVSDAAVRDADLRLRLTERTIERMGRLLRGVTITGPRFVTLSSSRGLFPLTITNQLDRPVTVSVSVETAEVGQLDDARFGTDPPLEIGPGQRDTVTVDARLGRVGVTTARAYVMTSGRRFGTPLVFNLRTSVVGAVIWGVLGLGGALLAFAIGRRLWRRRRGGPDRPDSTEAADGRPRDKVPSGGRTR